MYTKRLLQEQSQAHVPSAQRNTPAGSQIQSVPVIPKNVQTAIAVVAAVALVFALAGFLVSTASFTSSYGLGWTVIASFEGGLTGMIGCTLIATTSTFVLTYILCAPKRIAGVNQNITPPSRQAPVIENEDADSNEADIRLTRNGGGAGIGRSDSREPDELLDDGGGHTNSEDVNGSLTPDVDTSLDTASGLSKNDSDDLEQMVLELEMLGKEIENSYVNGEGGLSNNNVQELENQMLSDLDLILRSSTVDSSKSRRKWLREKIEGEKNAHSADEDISEEEVHKERKAARLERRKKTKRSNSAGLSRRSSLLNIDSKRKVSSLTPEEFISLDRDPDQLNEMAKEAGNKLYGGGDNDKSPNSQELAGQIPADLDSMGLVKHEKVSDSEKDKKPPTIPLEDLKSNPSELGGRLLPDDPAQQFLVNRLKEYEHKHKCKNKCKHIRKVMFNISALISSDVNVIRKSHRKWYSDLTPSVNGYADTTAGSKKVENNLENLTRKAILFDDKPDNNNEVPLLPDYGSDTPPPPKPSNRINRFTLLPRDKDSLLSPGGREGSSGSSTVCNSLAEQIENGLRGLKKVEVDVDERKKSETDLCLSSSVHAMLDLAKLTHPTPSNASESTTDSSEDFEQEIMSEEEGHKSRPVETPRQRRKQMLITYEHQQHLDRIEAAKNSQTGVLGCNDEITGGLHESVQKLELELSKHKKQNEIQLEQFKIKYKKKHGHELNLEVLEYRTGLDLEFKAQLEADKKLVQSADRKTLTEIAQRYHQKCKAFEGTPEEAEVKQTNDSFRNSVAIMLNQVKTPKYDNSEYQTFIQAKKEWEFYCTQLWKGKSNDEATLTLPEKKGNLSVEDSTLSDEENKGLSS